MLEGLVARIDLDDYVERVQAALEGMPEYQRFVDGQAELGDRGPAGIRWNLEIFLRWATDGGPPTAAELEQLRELIGARAAEGRPPEEGLAVYRRAMRAGWEAVLESADEHERSALGGAFELLLEWLDIVSAVFEQAYAEERDALVSRQERRARWLLERIVAGDGLGPDDQRLADVLGFELGGAHRSVVVALAEGSAAQHLQLARLLREQGALAISEGKRVVGLARTPVDEGALGFAGRLVLCEAPARDGGGDESWRGADPTSDRQSPRSGTAVVDAAGLAEELDDLRIVVALALAGGERGRVERDGRLPELLLAHSPRLARKLERRVFGPLLEAGRNDLADTLALLAANGFERSATAAALPVHRNTLVQRVARIEQLTGLDLDDPRDRGTAWLAALSRNHA